MAIGKFRKGETTYICQSCKKTTRNTGGDEVNCRLCLDCFNLAGIDNHLSDNGIESMLDSYGDEAKAILLRRPELATEFPRIAEACK